MVLCFVTIVLTLLYFYDVSATPFYRFEGQSCPLRSGRTGVCRDLRDCSSALAGLQKRITPVNCSYRGRDSIVCCDPRSIPTTTSESVTVTTSLSRSNRDAYISSKSEEVCKSYNNELPLQLKSFILGGEYVEPGELPHMAALGYVQSGMSTITWDCTGSLISDLYVMTAAHCVRTRTGKKLVRVRLGSIDLNSRSDDSEEFQVEDSFVVHPGYSTIRSYNDIALIRLPRKVKLNERLFPACLYTREDLPRGPFTIAGWGATDKDGLMMSTELRKAMIQPLSLDRCNQTYPIGPKLRMGLNEDMLCFYDPNGETDTCMGDSGGPLQVLTEENSDVYSVVGITSFGPATCGGGPAVYTKVASFIPWIEKIVWP